MSPVLISLPYSPWSERARWALEVRRVDYQKRTYEPLFGEPELRWRLKKWFGPVSVPVLVLADRAIGDSYLIAKWADTQGLGPPYPETGGALPLSSKLFPEGAETQILRWNDTAQIAMSAGRLLSLARVLQSDEALEEFVPRPLRLGAPSLMLARYGVQRTMGKYRAGGDLRGQEPQLVAALTSLREALGPKPAERPATLLSEFSYADITAAQMVAFVKPPESRHFKIGPHNKKAFGDLFLAERFADLVEWRDRLYSLYREPRS